MSLETGEEVEVNIEHKRPYVGPFDIEVGIIYSFVVGARFSALFEQYERREANWMGLRHILAGGELSKCTGEHRG